MATKTFGDKWQVVGQIGEGGQAWTYEVESAGTGGGNTYVLKRLKNKSRIERFKREVKALSQINHPNVVHIVDFDLDADEPYLVTDFCRGGTLEDARPYSFSPASRLFDLFGQICDGVLAAHSADVIHRDLKPANVFLSETKSGDAVVGDFGLCLTENDDAARITGPSEAVGPRLYMAPELEDGRYENATKACDVYSLGKLLYWLFSNGRAFAREKHREPKFDLCTTMGNPFLEHVNRLLDGMIVEEPDDRLPLPVIRERLPVAQKLVSFRYNPVGGPMEPPCLYCGMGRYVLRGYDSESVAAVSHRTPVADVWRLLVCDYCGNVQSFRIDLTHNGSPWK